MVALQVVVVGVAMASVDWVEMTLMVALGVGFREKTQIILDQQQFYPPYGVGWWCRREEDQAELNWSKDVEVDILLTWTTFAVSSSIDGTGAPLWSDGGGGRPGERRINFYKF